MQYTRLKAEASSRLRWGWIVIPLIAAAVLLVLQFATHTIDIPSWFSSTSSSAPAPVRLYLSAAVQDRYLDPSTGIVWRADTNYTLPASARYVTTNRGTSSIPYLYSNGHREFDGSGSYALYVTPGYTYTLTLLLYEPTFQQSGQRVYSVLVNGQAAFSNLDVYAVAGYQTPSQVSALVQSSSSTMIIEFQGTVAVYGMSLS